MRRERIYNKKIINGRKRYSRENIDELLKLMTVLTGDSRFEEQIKEMLNILVWHRTGGLLEHRLFK